MIPKNIYILHHKLKMDDDISKKWTELHPEFEINHFNYQNIELFFASIPIIYKNIYVKIRDDALKTDFLRFVILNEKGGFVIDSNLEPIHNIDIFPAEKSIILSKTMEENDNNIYCNKFIASTPKHPIVERLCNSFINHYLDGSYFISHYWKASNLMDLLLDCEKDKDVLFLEQKCAHFFYDACFMYKKRRIINDKTPYFSDSIHFSD
jgi:hypothetical protein